MELFDKQGHLTDSALHALITGENIDELGRLEISEHLSYCDECLMRYTDMLTEDILQTPEISCERTLWQRIRMRTLKIITSRYAMAAAAIAIVITLWSGGTFTSIVESAGQAAELQSSISQQFDLQRAELDTHHSDERRQTVWERIGDIFNDNNQQQSINGGNIK